MKSEILVTTRFNENSDLSMTYLGRTNMIRENKIAAEEKFPMSEQRYTTGRLLLHNILLMISQELVLSLET